METFIATYRNENDAEQAMGELIEAGFDPGLMEFEPSFDGNGGVAYEAVEAFATDHDSKGFVKNVHHGDAILALQCTPKRQKEALEIFKDHNPNILESRRTDNSASWTASKSPNSETKTRDSRANRGGAPTSPQYVDGDRPTSKDYVRRDPSSREHHDKS